MYINIQQDKQCGQCSALNQHETVWHNNEYIIRCRRCGHEKVIAVLTTASTTNAPIIYNAGKLPSKEIF
jgi:uncharacterized Zn finger protein